MQTLQISIYLLAFLIALALLFDFMNGFHDAANSIATVVSTGVLKPQQAVAMAALFNVVAIFVFQLKVAATIGKGTIEPAVIDHYVVFGALAGAIGWNVVTWYHGIPSSSSHALIGGLVGAAVAKAGTASLISSGVLKTLCFILLSPLLGFILGSLMMVLVSWVFVRSTPRRVDRWFRRMQLVSASMYSLGHGGNDAQKTMGIIWMLLIAAGYSTSSDPLPWWVIISCYAALGLGTLFGGWRIVKTMGQKITKLKPAGGFCAEAGRCGHAVYGNGARYTGVHHADHHRRHRRRRFGEKDVCRALGHCRQYRLGLGADDFCVRVHCGRRMVGRNPRAVNETLRVSLCKDSVAGCRKNCPA